MLFYNLKLFYIFLLVVCPMLIATDNILKNIAQLETQLDELQNKLIIRQKVFEAPAIFTQVPSRYHLQIINQLSKTKPAFTDSRVPYYYTNSYNNLATWAWQALFPHYENQIYLPVRSSYIYFYHESPPGLQEVSLANFLTYSQLDIDKARTDLLPGLVNLYKIHLMPKEDDIVDIISMLLAQIDSNAKFKDAIRAIKLLIDRPDKEKLSKKVNKDILPIIVIYPIMDKEAAQYVLDIVYKLFKNKSGLGITPRFNAKVTDLIYWAQGNADDKLIPVHAEYFEEPDKICYRADISGNYVDYYLKNPALSS